MITPDVRTIRRHWPKRCPLAGALVAAACLVTAAAGLDARVSAQAWFPSSVRAHSSVAVSLRPGPGTSGAKAELLHQVGRTWRVVSSRTELRPGHTISLRTTASASGALVLRAEVIRGKRVVWASKIAHTLVTISTSVPGGSGGSGGGGASGGGPPPPPPSITDTLTAGQALTAGHYLLSPNHQYELIMQSDGNLVLYKSGGVALWATGTSGAGSYVAMQGDGNFVVYRGATATWSSDTADFPGASILVSNDGSLAISRSGQVLWNRTSGYVGDWLPPGQTLNPNEYLLSPNHQYKLVMQASDGNLVLYQGSQALWASGGGGGGAYLAMQGTDGNMVVYHGGTATWSSNTAGFAGASLYVQDDANLVVYRNSQPLWDRYNGYIGNELQPGETLYPGEYLLSPNHTYELVVQATDGNLVLYQSGGTALWATGAGGAGARVVMQGTDGNLVVYNGGTATWASNTGGHAGADLLVQDDSNLVIYQSGTALWDRHSGLLGGGSSQASRIVAAAQAMQSAGYPYCFDGGTPSGPSVGITDKTSDGSYSNCSQIGKVGFDCTGLTLYAVYQGTGNAGLSHDGRQAQTGGGQVISRESSLEPGDIVYFDRNAANGLAAIDHAGIYVGGGNVLSAASEHFGILTESIAWYAADGLHFVGGVRYWH